MIEFHRIEFGTHKDLCVTFREDSFRERFPENWHKYWDEEGYRNWIEGYADRFPDGVLHIWCGNQIIGQLEFAYSGENGHVNLYYLIPDYRGKEYGVNAHEHIVSTIRRDGCKTASLRASPINTRAISFYKKLGWVDLGQEPDHSHVHKFSLNL